MKRATWMVVWFSLLVLIVGMAATFSCGDDDDDDDDSDPATDDDDDNDTSDDDDDSSDDDDDSADDDDDDDDDTAPTNFALDYDGIDDYVVVSDSTSLNVTTAMTVEAWIYVRSANPSGWNNIVAHYDYENEDNNQGWTLRLRNGKLFFSVLNDAELVARADTEVEYNQWIHVAGTFDGENITLWMGGFKVDETAFASEIGQATSNLFIGSNRVPNYFFDGLIDEVRLSKVARYDANFTPEMDFADDTHTLGLWHFDESTGNIANDESSNGNHGTLHGPTWVER